MKFIYKIHSGYDGFQPKRIPERLIDNRLLNLGWKRYLDEVEKGDEVWVYFHGPGQFRAGVYAEGRVVSKDPNAEEVRIRVYRCSLTSPITHARIADRIASIVATRYRQVFLFPEEWEADAVRTVSLCAVGCGERECELCSVWKGLPLLRQREMNWPPRLPGNLKGFVPGYWAIPPRCFVGASSIKVPIRQTTQLLKAFKIGNEQLAYPLALAMFEALNRYDPALAFDAIVPIPLSPDKAEKGEIHRTRLLARELSQMFDVPVKELLLLKGPISKRRMLSAGYTYAEFLQAYSSLLEAKDSASNLSSILLVDDVSTQGGTLATAASTLWGVNPAMEIVAAAATQMILKAVVRDQSDILRAP